MTLDYQFGLASSNKGRSQSTPLYFTVLYRALADPSSMADAVIHDADAAEPDQQTQMPPASKSLTDEELDAKYGIEVWIC